MSDIDNVALRLYTAADASAVKTLHGHAFEVLAAHCHTREQIEAHRALIAAPAYDADLARSHIMMAVTRGAIIGTAGWIEVPDRADTARIRKVFVDPATARRGLATRLVRVAEQAATATGRRYFIVRANLNAVPLYEKLGYRIVSEGSVPTADGIELPVRFMEKRG